MRTSWGSCTSVLIRCCFMLVMRMSAKFAVAHAGYVRACYTMSIPTLQLMELAGLSVASALHLEYDSSKFKRVLILVGPGNNGGGESEALHIIKQHIQDRKGPCDVTVWIKN